MPEAKDLARVDGDALSEEPRTAASASGHTPGPWTACRMVHELTDGPMSPEQVGEYVCNSVRKSAAESGSLDFLFVSATTDRGVRDVCHVGNGPMSPANARLIAAAPDLYAAIKDSMQYLDQTIGPCDEGCECILHDLHAALAKAEGR